MRSGVYLWAVVAGFLVGVFARSFFPLGISFAVWTALLAVASVFFVRTTKGAIVVALVLLAFSGGIIRMNAAVMTGDQNVTAHIGENATLEGVVVQEPDVRDSGTLISIAADTLITKYEKNSIHAGILVQAPPHASVGYGDRVRAFGTLQLPESFDTGEGRQFEYPEYLAVQGMSYQLMRAQVETADGDWSGNPLKAFAIGVKELYLRGEEATLPEPEAGLAGGITVGDKRSIGPELSADFQRVSLIHMVVLSGYNITVVINAVARMLMWAPQLVRFGASGFVVVFFALMSGGAASAVRAGAMALLAVYAHASKRVFLASRALGVVALGMVLYNPFTLAFDPSFQLSALATIGLIMFTPIFSTWLRRVPERFGIREILSSTAGTQLAVLPFLLYQNGMLSVVALPANLLALAPVPFAMLFSFAAALGGMLFGSYATPLAAPAYLLLAYIIAVGKFFAGLPFAAVSLPVFSAWWMFAAYAALFCGAAWWYAGRSIPVSA